MTPILVMIGRENAANCNWQLTQPVPHALMVKDNKVLKCLQYSELMCVDFTGMVEHKATILIIV